MRSCIRAFIRWRTICLPYVPIPGQLNEYVPSVRIWIQWIVKKTSVLAIGVQSTQAINTKDAFAIILFQLSLDQAPTVRSPRIGQKGPLDTRTRCKYYPVP